MYSTTKTDISSQFPQKIPDNPHKNFQNPAISPKRQDCFVVVVVFHCPFWCTSSISFTQGPSRLNRLFLSLIPFFYPPAPPPHGLDVIRYILQYDTTIFQKLKTKRLLCSGGGVVVV